MTKAELEAKRDELIKSTGNAWIDNDIRMAIKRGCEKGFDAAAALLQEEMDVLIDRLKATKHSEWEYQCKLQSANAKLDKAIKFLNGYKDGCGCMMGDPKLENWLEQLSAIDASEGKGEFMGIKLEVDPTLKDDEWYIK